MECREEISHCILVEWVVGELNTKEVGMKLKSGELEKLYRGLVLARRLEEKMLEISASGRNYKSMFTVVWEWRLSGVGTCTFLRKDDYVIATHRGYSNKIAKGISLKKMLAEFYGKKSGYGKGKDSHHLTAKEVNFVGKWGLIGGQFPIAVGLGFAAQAKGDGQVCVIFFGDGASNRGTFHEALNLASLWKLPIVWVCENNQYSVTTSFRSAYRRRKDCRLCEGLSDARAYGRWKRCLGGT